MKRKTVVCSAAPLVGMLTGMLGYAGGAKAENPSEIVLFLMDESGTMSTKETCKVDGSTGTRRWECAVQDALGWLSKNAPTEEEIKDYYFWKFGMFLSEPHDNEHTMKPGVSEGPGDPLSYNPSKPLGSIQERLERAKSEGPFGAKDPATPLAAAYCNAVEWLKNKRADYSYEVKLTIKLETDGEENATPVDSECYGVDGGDYVPPAEPSTLNFVTSGSGDEEVYVKVNGLTVPSYQSNMLDKALTGKVNVPAYVKYAFSKKNPVISNTTFLGEFLGMTALAGESVEGPVPPAHSAAAPANATAGVSMSKDATFLNGLATLTGGRLLDLQSPHAPGDPNAEHVIPGDANDDGCVNAEDYSLIRQFYGQQVDASVPATYGVDVTMDGAIDIYDYLLVKQKYGTGCAVPPGPAPQLGNAIFGFDDPSLWTSSAALTLVGGPRTEGVAALKVGGSGWRELSTVSFNTAALQGITSRIAFDIFITATPVNPYWLGQTQLYVNCPSAGIYNQFIGAVELTGRPIGRFTTVQYSLPANVVNAMRTPHSDLSIKIAVNQPDVGAIVDNMRFVPPAFFASGQGGRIVAASNADGRVEVFYMLADNRIYHSWQNATYNGWEGPAPMDVPNARYAEQIAAGRNHAGHLEVFYVGTNGLVYHNWQDATNLTGWHGESWLGGSPASQIGVGQNADERLEVFYSGRTNSNLYHNRQTTADGGWFGESPLGGAARSLAVGSTEDERLHIFTAAGNYQINHNWQVAPNSGWNGQVALAPGNLARQIAVGRNADGHIEIFYVGTDGRIYHNRQNADLGDTHWDGEGRLADRPSQEVVVGQNEDGRLEVFYLGTDGVIYHKWQELNNDVWSAEFLLGSGARHQAQHITVGQNKDLRLEVFFIGSDGNSVYHRWQTAPNADWSGEFRL